MTITGLASTMCAGTWTFCAAATGLKIGNGIMTETYTAAVDKWAAAATQSAGYTVTFANLGLTFTVDCNTLSAGTGVSAAFCGATVALGDTGVTSLNVEGATSGTYKFVSGTAAGSIQIGNGTSTQTISGISPGTAQELNFNLLGLTFNIGTAYTENDLEGVEFTVEASGTSGSTFQVGADNDTNNQLSFTISSLRSTATTGLGLTYGYLDTATEAQSMLDLVDSAISTLSSRRGDVGAAMNRLSYAAANLATTIENVQAAESVIRDVDMAAEMTSFTKSQILLQAGTAMLAQANMAPQNILSLIGQ
jgi:flagellin